MKSMEESINDKQQKNNNLYNILLIYIYDKISLIITTSTEYQPKFIEEKNRRINYSIFIDLDKSHISCVFQ